MYKTETDTFSMRIQNIAYQQNAWPSPGDREYCNANRSTCGLADNF